MSEALAVEWSAKNINVNAIAPGAFSSEMMDGMMKGLVILVRLFLERGLDFEQMDSTLLFLVSPSSECVTGTLSK